MKAYNQKKLRIAMLSIHSDPMGKLGTYDTGGMSVYIRELAGELGSAGHSIDMYTQSNGDNRAREVLVSDNIRQIHINSGQNGHVPKARLYYYIPEFFRSLEAYRKEKDRGYDLIHSHYWLSGLLGKKAQTEWNVPHVTTFHTTGIAKRITCSREQEPALRLISEKKLASECDRVFAPTRREHDFFVKYYRVPSEKIAIVPCGVNLKRFQLMRRDDARKQLGLSNTKFLVLFVGRFVPIKGIDRLIASISHLSHKEDLDLVIVGGDGKNSESTVALRRLVRTSETDTIVKFAGRIDHRDLPLYYNATNILVVPSYYESFGLVALESLACGTPVVAPRVGAMESVIQNGQTGFILDECTPQSLARAIERFRSSGNGFRSREEIRSSVLRHSWGNTAAKAMREYLSVLGYLTAHKEEEGPVS